MADFVGRHSVVRRIWGDADSILLVFAGSAAEFALNRAVDWLFFTGELPRDPIGRLFATARWAQDIVFADEATALGALERIRAIHGAVERQRQDEIPDWAHRDVLYMLIGYSERAHELLHGPLDAEERSELYDVFRRVGTGLGIPELPATYAEWQTDRQLHLERDLARGRLSEALYAEYRRHLGAWRYELLLRVQAVLVPEHVRRLLGLAPAPLLEHAIPAYRALIRVGLRPLIYRMVMPPRYLPEFQRLDQPAVPSPG